MLQTLLWYPRSKQVEAIRFAERRSPSSGCLIANRNLGLFTPAFADVQLGPELLPVGLRARHAEGIALFWVPTTPTQCVLATRDRAGFIGVTAGRPRRDTMLSGVLERLEMKCAVAFDEAFDVEPDLRDLGAHLDAVLALVLDAVTRIEDFGTLRLVAGGVA